MDKVLSIIIPTYNMEKYLNKCLDSLLVPNMDLLEVLVINDGSKDRSSEIAHEYEKKYPGVFRVIDKENGNYGSCINRGLREATGKYVKVLDADDSFDSVVFNEYLEIINCIDVDLILTDYVSIDDNGKSIRVSCYDLPQNEVVNFNSLFRTGHINFQINMHAITYKLQNLLKMEYTQTEGISYTDMEWCFTPMTTVQNGIYLKLCLYKYLIGRPGQTMDLSIRKKQIGQLMTMSLSLAERYKKNFNQDYKVYLWYMAFTQILNIYKLSLVDKYQSYDDLLKYDLTLKEINSEIYYELEKVRICQIHYIKIWRKYGSKLIQLIVNSLFELRNYFTN